MTEDQRWPLASALIGDAKVENLVISNADPFHALSCAGCWAKPRRKPATEATAGPPRRVFECGDSALQLVGLGSWL